MPHDWLLPFCCAAVHHGGAGTVAAVCHAGIPQAVLPVAWDQPWWAEHLEQMGLGAADKMGEKSAGEKYGDVMLF